MRYGQIKRETNTQSQTDRDSGIVTEGRIRTGQTHTGTDRQTKGQTNRWRDMQREIHRGTDRKGQAQRQRDTNRKTHTNR